jgi:hypothetical protein
MAKTLSESAAEILKASMGSAGKEPMQHEPNQVVDLGGQTPTELPSDIGVKAAADAKQAPKPGSTGVPAEPMKKLQGSDAKKIGDEEENLKKNPVDAGSVKAEETEVEGEVVAEEELSELEEVVAESKSEDDENDEDEDEDEDEDDAEEMKMKMKKEMVEKYRGSMREDVDALFNGESLSEDFRVKATLIFETAVTSRVEKILEDISAENETILAEAYEEIKTELTEQVDEYLNYVVEQWVEKNEVAIESGLRAELTEDFINGLKNLFAEHYIEIPDEKIDVASELANKVVDLETVSAEKDALVASLTEQLNSVKKEKAIVRACESLTAVQAEKMKSLAESVEFTTEGDFENKLAVIRENYFPSKTNVTSEVKALQETIIDEEKPEVVQAYGMMKHYVQAISKTNPKV